MVWMKVKWMILITASMSIIWAMAINQMSPYLWPNDIDSMVFLVIVAIQEVIRIVQDARKSLCEIL